MPYKNIVYAKLEKRLLHDYRWFSLPEETQLIYIKLILSACETYNVIPKNVQILRQLLHISKRGFNLEKHISLISKAFPKFKENSEHYYFEDFEEKTNYIQKPKTEILEIPGIALGCPKDVAEKEKIKIKKREETTYVVFEKTTVTDWNLFCDKNPTLPKIKEISEKRRFKLKHLFRSTTFQDFKAILTAIEEQPFLCGENDRKWVVSLDWLIENDTNFLKVLERKYSNGQRIPEGLEKYRKQA